MKKLTMILGCATLILVASCKKSADGNKSVLPEENTAAITPQNNDALSEKVQQSISGANKSSESYTYKALDGGRATVTFNNLSKDKTITVQANNNKFQLSQTGIKDGAATYEREGITATAKGDSVIVVQGENIIPLVLDK